MMGTLYDCLLEVHLEKYYETFLNHGISKAESLLKLTPRDYGVLGLNTTEERRRLYELINLLRSVLNPSNHFASGPSRQRNGRKRIHSPGDTVKKEFPLAPRTPSPLQKDPRSPWSPVFSHSASISPADRCNPDATLSNSYYIDNSRGSPQSPLFIERVKHKSGYNYGVPKSKKKGKPSGTRDVKEERIKVCVRKRPLCGKNAVDVVEVHDEQTVIVNEMKVTVDLTSYILQHKFFFDDAFGEHFSNEDVYIRAAKPLIEWVFEKGQATIFAYGQTGAGKTFTMMGSGDTPGLYLLAAEDIFSIIESEIYGSGFHVWLSYYEIYCGQLFDLLNGKKRLHAREDSSHKVCISGLTETQVPDVSSLMQVLDVGNACRSKGSTGANPDSSRSHAILQLQLRDSMDEYVGRISFIDLAGNERAADVKDSDRQSRKEGAEINQSLLALKECIRSLDQESSFTPFRQSKLTHILKDSFMGKSKTCMIANISPNQNATECTLNTLRYADRVKEIRPDTGSPRVMRRKSTDNTYANKNSSGVGASPSYFHPSNILCTSTPIRRQCSEYNPASDTTLASYLDPNESPIHGHRIPRKVSNKFNILPDKITVSKCMSTPEPYPTGRPVDCLSLEFEFENYRPESCPELKIENIQFCEDNEPLTSDFNYDLNDLNKTKKGTSGMICRDRIIHCEGGAYISPPRFSLAEIRMQCGNSMPSVEDVGVPKRQTPLCRVRNHSDPGLMPSTLANFEDDCRIKRQSSSEEIPMIPYDKLDEHCSSSTESDHALASPENILRFPSNQVTENSLNQRLIDMELKTIFPLPPSPPCVKPAPVDCASSAATKRDQIHASSFWERGFNRVTEPFISVSHMEPNCRNPLAPAKHLSTTLTNKPHQSVLPEEKNHPRKISKDPSKKDETVTIKNSSNNTTSTLAAIPSGTVPTTVVTSRDFDQSQISSGIYTNKLTVAEELLSSFKDSSHACAVQSNQEKSPSKETRGTSFDAGLNCHDTEYISHKDSKPPNPGLSHVFKNAKERKDKKDCGTSQSEANPRSPETLPDLCVSDIAAMKQSLFQFLQKMSTISTKATDNAISEPLSHESSFEGAVYPPSNCLDSEPLHTNMKLSNVNKTVNSNAEVVSNQSPILAGSKRDASPRDSATPQGVLAVEPVHTPKTPEQTQVNAWSSSSQKTGFFPIDPQPVHNPPSPILSKSPVPRHVVYPVPFLPSAPSVSENRHEGFDNKEVCERLIQAHEKQLGTMTMLCKQEMKLLLLAKSGQKSFTDFIEKVSQILSCKLKAISLLQQEIQIHRASVSAAGSHREAVFCADTVGSSGGDGGGRVASSSGDGGYSRTAVTKDPSE